MAKAMDARGDGGELHRLLGMDEGQARQSLLDEGVDPEAEVAAMRRLGRAFAARFGRQAECEEMPLHELSKRFAVYEGAVAAGHPDWGSSEAGCSRASLLDVLRKGDEKSTLWARVSGWSMRGEGINDGDMVLVDASREAQDGDIVLAHLAGRGQVVKRLSRANGRVALLSANAEFEDIVVEDELSMRIHGVVVGRAGTL